MQYSLYYLANLSTNPKIWNKICDKITIKNKEMRQNSYLCEATEQRLSTPGGSRGSGMGPQIDSLSSGMTQVWYSPCSSRKTHGPKTGAGQLQF